VLKLRNAMREYENDRWRIVSTKVGNGFSPAACKEKVTELEQEQEGVLDAEEEEESMEQAATEHPGSASSEGNQRHMYQ
jgi:hypothetical protein